LDIATLLLFIGLLLAFIMAMNLGGNDAANPTSAAIGAGVMTIKRALICFSIFTLAGALLQGFMVMKTIGSGIVPSIDIAGAFAIILSANIWIFFATLRGMAISTSHSIICAVVGYGLVRFGLGGFNMGVLGSIALSWVVSPLCSLALSFIIFRIIVNRADRSEVGRRDGAYRFFKILVIVSLCFSAYSFGANDVANATGVFLTIAAQVGQVTDTTAILFLTVFGVAGIVVGGAVFGPRVIETLAFRVTRLDLPTGLAASLSNALTVYLFTTIPYLIFGFGLPISTSYAAVGSIVGASLARSSRSVSRGISAALFSYWVITVPINIAIAGGVYYLLTLLL